MVRITREMVMAGRSDAGGWNRRQVELLGGVWPPMHGWIDKLIGKEISENAAARFMALRGYRSSSVPKQEFRRRAVIFVRLARQRLPEALFEELWRLTETA